MKNKILIISHELTYTGAPHSLLNVARALREMQYEVEIWSLCAGPFMDELYSAGFEVKIVRLEQPLSMGQIYYIQQFDLAIANTIFCAETASILNRYIKTILYIREAENIPDLIQQCNLDPNVISNFKHIICVSEYAQEFLKRRYGISNSTVVHNYVPDQYDGSLNLLKKNTVNFIVSGTIEKRKQQQIVIEAFRRMPVQLRKQSYLHIVGNNPDWAREYWQEFLPIEDDRITYYGSIEDDEKRIELYKKMNVFIIPSLDESCSLVALEGAMLGRAIILSNHVGAKYLFDSDKYLFDIENVEQLCRKMAMLTSRRELLLQGLKMRKAYKNTSTKDVYKKNIGNTISKYLEMR